VEIEPCASSGLSLFPWHDDNNSDVDDGDSCVLIDDIDMMVTTIMQMQSCINHAASLQH